MGAVGAVRELALFLGTLLYAYAEAAVRLLLPARRKAVGGELVLLTGAGRGLGRATAREFARRQSRLVLWDVDTHGLRETAAECEKLGATVHTFVVDCSKREEIYSAAEKTTRAFLPTMMDNNRGHIVTVASAAGHFVTSFMVAYCSSKFAAVGFHKALTEELSTLGKDGIKTTCLCPVFINTGFVKNPSTRLGRILEVDEVVKELMEGILTNKKMVFVPSNQSFALLLERLLPERALNYLKKLTDVKFDAIIGQRSNQ
uniref:Estradiol 17-beta-dehydrogenase 11 n=1 Tax=Anas platyrhynchos platyrhynchos TaxID=8840 RepID=A0A493T1E6_ANAPP